MSKNDLFLELKNKINQELEIYFDQKIKQIKKNKKPKELLEMTENLKKFVLSGGKRIRPALFYYGYCFNGGKERKSILRASISMELIHSYFLIHDDIIDRDNFRHDDWSMHYHYQKEYQKIFGNKKKKLNSVDSDKIEHFGVSMAILVGNLASNFGYEILTNLDFPANLKIKAIEKMNKVIFNTATGEAMDVALAERLNASVDVDDVIEMQRYKTAKYTIEGPLQLGAILAGADEKRLKQISDFTIPLGIAFQIQDDIIGVFGDEKKIGKSVGSDIEEGKKTLLSVKTFAEANAKQLKSLSQLFGKQNISLDEVKAFRKIVIETGSLKYSLVKIEELIKFSKKQFEEMKISPECRNFFVEFINYIAKRRY